MDNTVITDIYNLVNGILFQSTNEITSGLYNGARIVFDKGFFISAMAIAIAYIGWKIAWSKTKNDEALYSAVWMLIMFAIVQLMIKQGNYYQWFIDGVNIPRDTFVEMINTIVTNVNPHAGLENILNTLMTTTNSIASASFANGSLTNWLPFAYGIIAYLTGTFLIIIIVVMTLFSKFLSNITMALLPFVVVTLLWKKTEYVFFAWIKLYISLSLYAPFTMIFGLVSIHVVNLSMSISQNLAHDYMNSAEMILILVIVQGIIIIGIFKIPNIINQLIGSANEGSSMTSGVGALSSGATLLMGAAKYTGLVKGGQIGASGAKAGGSYLAKQSLLNKGEIKQAMDYISSKVMPR
ncbi:MAG: type IV secretion system protein [Arcobacter sp.]|uniref:type IV secretion system protein n=1 Tax=Arcobacter sp. TaxID=1872629 RepID=UPI003C78E3BC